MSHRTRTAPDCEVVEGVPDFLLLDRASCEHRLIGEPARGEAVVAADARHLFASDAGFLRETMTEVELDSGGLAVSLPEAVVLVAALVFSGSVSARDEAACVPPVVESCT